MNPAKPYLDRVKVNGRINITRPSTPDCRDVIKISVIDDDARITVFEGEMTAENFALCITGLSDQQIRGFSSTAIYALGKERVYEKRQVVLPKEIDYRDRSKWVEENCQEEGWFVDSHLGSRGSISHDPNTGTHTANYRVFRYVEKTNT